MIEFKGRQFDFNYPNPRDGCFIMDRLQTYKMPYGGDKAFGLAGGKKESMNYEQFGEFQIICLKHAYEEIPLPSMNGETKTNKVFVVGAQGSYGINDCTPALVEYLQIEFTSFFTEQWVREAS